MASSSGEGFLPNCMLAHHLINQLTAIVGYCDLLADEGTADEGTEDSNCSKRLLQIREIATSAAEELSQHLCRLDAVTRSASAYDPSLSPRT